MTIKNLAPGKIANYYALLSYKGFSPSEALDIVRTSTYEKLCEITGAKSSIQAGISAIDRFMIQRGGLVTEYITGESSAPSNYFNDIGEKIVLNFGTEEDLCYGVVKVIEEIHNNWVVENSDNFLRIENINDGKLYQHLPLALIGLNEFSKDAMFIAPIFDCLGYSIGEMKEGEGIFMITAEIISAYKRYVSAYLMSQSIYSNSDLQLSISRIISNYSALKVSSAPEGKEDSAKKRIEYMLAPEKLTLLYESAKKNLTL